MSEAISYKCPGCGAPLRFDAAEGMLKCDSCGNTFAPDYFDIAGDAGAEKGSVETNFDWGNYNREEVLEKIEDTRVYRCQSCGAEIVTDATTAATKCPYCDNVVVLEPQLSGMLKPNAIIPFKVTPKDLGDIVKNLYKGKKLLPKGFLDENKVKEIQGVYVPFWLYDCKVDADVQFDATKVRMWSDRNYDYTETKHYRVDRSGSLRFKKIPVDGSKKMANDLMDSVEPYDYSELVDFDPAYLTGYLADRYDEDVEESFARAAKRAEESVTEKLKETASEYTTVTKTAADVKASDTSAKYVLLPVYLINARFRNEDYQYAVNGQTGKIVGKLPSSFKKLMAYFFSILGGFTALGIILALILK